MIEARVEARGGVPDQLAQALDVHQQPVVGLLRGPDEPLLVADDNHGSGSEVGLRDKAHPRWVSAVHARHSGAGPRTPIICHSVPAPNSSCGHSVVTLLLESHARPGMIPGDDVGLHHSPRRPSWFASTLLPTAQAHSPLTMVSMGTPARWWTRLDKIELCKPPDSSDPRVRRGGSPVAIRSGLRYVPRRPGTADRRPGGGSCRPSGFARPHSPSRGSLRSRRMRRRKRRP